ncbi:MAG: PEGA domain-containing protein [Polyangiaceae bacterium]
MHRLRLALFVTLAAMCLATASAAQERDPHPDLRRAHDFDAQGSRAFKDGRYKDAILFFTEAYRFGAPPIELWNVAKCHMKLDEPEAAEDAFRRYLEEPNLTAGDRADATQELEELRGRPSTLAIDSDPTGATFTIDGSPNARGTTPGSIDIPPGKHHVHVEKEKAGAYDVDVDARLGRALILHAKLGDNGGGEVSTPPSRASSEQGNPAGITFSEDFGFFIPKLGGYADSVRPVLHLAASYAFIRTRNATLWAGLRFDATTDGWHTTVATALPAGAPPPQCLVGPDFQSTELAAFLVAGAKIAVTPRFELGGDAGVGFFSLGGSPTGGEVFNVDCNPSYGFQPGLHAGTQASFVLAAYGPFRVRAILEPVIFQAHSSFNGTRDETNGLWWRIGSALGFALDF